MRLFLVALISLEVLAVISFEEAIDLGIKRSVEYARATNNLHLTKVDKKVRMFKFVPTASASVTISEQDDHFSQLNENRDRTARVGLNYTLTNFGRDFFNYQAGKKRVESSKSSLKSTLIERESNIANIYLTYIKNLKDLDIRKSILDLKTQALTIAQKRYRGGFMSQQDLNKIKVDVSNAKAAVLNAQNTINESINSIWTIAGQITIDIEWPWQEYIKSKKFIPLFEEEFKLNSLPDWNRFNNLAAALDYEYKADKKSTLKPRYFSF